MVLSQLESEAAADDKSTTKRERSWEEQLKDDWSAVTEHHLSPLGPSLSAMAGLLLLLLVLTRLLTGRVVSVRQVSPSDGERRWTWILGGTYLVVAAAVGVFGTGVFRDSSQVNWRDATVLGWGLVCVGLSAVGVWLIARARGTALALQVEVLGEDGSPDAAKAKRLIALLGQLGSQPPQRLNATGASDLTDLPADALSEVPTGAAAKAVFAVLRLVLPVPPWRLSLALATGSSGTIDITRNGVTVPDGSLLLRDASFAFIDPSVKSGEKAAAPDATEQTDRVLMVAAAQTLVVLSTRHASIKNGLTGADTWRGLAFHALALRAGVDLDTRNRLLRQAVNASPHFALAQLALAIGMDTTTEAEWRAFADKLDGLVKNFVTMADRAGYEAYAVRLYYNLAVARDNLGAYGPVSTGPAGEDYRKGRAAADQLNEVVGKIKSRRKPEDEGLKKFVAGVEVLIGYVDQDITAHQPDNPKRPTKIAPPQRQQEYYAHACLLAGLDDCTNDELDHTLDSRENELTLDPSQGETARRDPAFRHFRQPDPRATREQQRQFRKITGDPAPTGYLDLEPFRAFADALTKLGFDDLSDLTGATAAELARGTGVHHNISQRWLDVAALGQHVPWRDSDNHLAWLAILLAMDVASPTTFDQKASNPQAFYTDLVAKAEDSQLLPDPEDGFGPWWPRP